MISKLPKWAWYGAWVFAFIAGIVNVVGLMGFEHQAITHLTGTTSMLAQALASFDYRQAMHFTAIIGSFMAGTVLSGYLIQDSTYQLGHRYGVALILETILLCAAVPLFNRGNLVGTYLAACACGLQNAMMSTYSGTVVRTTHISGMLTDLGIFFGHWLRDIPVDRRRLRLCLVVVSGFLVGGIAGAKCFQRFGYAALYFPATITCMGALAYGIRHLRSRDNF